MDIYRPTWDIINYEDEREKIKKYIKLGVPIIIYGDYGVGKTSVMLWISKFVEKNIIYIKGDEISSVKEFENIVKRHLGFKYLLFGRKLLSRYTLLIDEADRMDEKILLRVKNMFDDGEIRNFVLSVINFKNIPRSILERVGKRKIFLKGISKEDVREFLEKKFGKFSKKISEEVLDYIFKKAGGNPRKIIEIVLDILMNLGKKEKITLVDVKKLFGEEVLTPIQKKILDALKEKEKSIDELSKELKISKSSVRARISELKKMGLIEEVGRRPKRYRFVE